MLAGIDRQKQFSAKKKSLHGYKAALICKYLLAIFKKKKTLFDNPDPFVQVPFVLVRHLHRASHPGGDTLEYIEVRRAGNLLQPQERHPSHGQVIVYWWTLELEHSSYHVLL